MSEIVRYYNEYSDIEISQKANIHSLLTKKILPLFRKLKDCMKLNKLFVLNVKIKRSVIFKTGMHLGCNLHKT